MAFSKPEPLRGKHSLQGFSCGEESLDTWLARYARTAEAHGSSKVFVTASDEKVVGFYALAAASVAPRDATQRLLKGQPASQPVPALLIARLAVDLHAQGMGVGRSLLMDALLRCAGVADEVGVRAILVHAIDEEARSFYARFGFEPSPTDQLHLVLLTKDLHALLDAAS